MYELVLFMGSGHLHCSCYTYCIHCTCTPPAEQEAESCVITITQNERPSLLHVLRTRVGDDTGIRYTTQPTCRTEQNLARSRKSTVPEDGKSLNLLSPIRCLSLGIGLCLQSNITVRKSKDAEGSIKIWLTCAHATQLMALWLDLFQSHFA